MRVHVAEGIVTFERKGCLLFSGTLARLRQLLGEGPTRNGTTISDLIAETRRARTPRELSAWVTSPEIERRFKMLDDVNSARVRSAYTARMRQLKQTAAPAATVEIKFPYAKDQEWCSHHRLYVRLALVAMARTPEQMIAVVRKFDNDAAWFETRRNLRTTAAHLRALADVCETARWRIRLCQRLAAESGPGPIALPTCSGPSDAAPAGAPGPETYAYDVTSDCMAPEFRRGDIALVDPHLPPKAGEAHIFYTDEAFYLGRPDPVAASMIRHLARETADEWHVEQWSPRPGEPRNWVPSKRKWPKCHRIVGTYTHLADC